MGPLRRSLLSSTLRLNTVAGAEAGSMKIPQFENIITRNKHPVPLTKRIFTMLGWPFVVRGSFCFMGFRGYCHDAEAGNHDSLQSSNWAKTHQQKITSDCCSRHRAGSQRLPLLFRSDRHPLAEVLSGSHLCINRFSSRVAREALDDDSIPAQCRDRVAIFCDAGIRS